MKPAQRLYSDRGQQRKLVVVLGVAMLAVAGVIGYLLWSGYKEAIRTAETTSRNYAAIIEARLDATLRRADAHLQELAREIPVASLSKQALPRYARSLEAGLDLRLLNFQELAGLRVFDTDGDQLYSSDRPNTPRSNIVDRGYFRRLRDDPMADLMFEVNVARTTGRLTLVVGRALRDGRGDFRGIAIASVELEYFQKLFQSLDLGDRGVVSIFRRDDFTQVVRWPEVAARAGISLPPSIPTRVALTAGKKIGTLEFVTVSDGIRRIWSFHALERYPFFVAAGFAREDVLAGWKRRALGAGLSGLMLLGLLVALLTRLWRVESRERKALSDLEQSEGRFRAIFKHAGVGIAMRPAHDRAHPWTQVNDQFCKLLGYTREELLRLSTAAITPADEVQRAVNDNERLLKGEIENYAREKRIIRKDGSSIWVILAVAALPDAKGRPKDMISVYQDITERKRVEEALRVKDNAIATSINAIVIADVTGRISYVNPTFVRMWGYADESEILGKTPVDFTHDPADAQSIVKAMLDRGFHVGQVIGRRKDSTIFFAEISASIVRDDHGRITHLMASFIDITERREAEAALRASEEKYRSIYENIQDVYVESTIEGTIIEISPQIETLSGGRYVRADLVGKPSVMFYAEPDRRAEFLRVLRERGSVKDFQVKLLNRDGSPVFCSVSARLIVDQEGKPQRVVATLRDVSERIRGEEQRKALESQLIQAQKMEAIGTLSGGIAHDFNNILGAIVGNVELARQDVGSGHVAQESLEEIAKAGRRGKDLVQQILAFSHKQEPQRRIVALPSVIDEVVKLMRAALPANIHLTSGFSPEASNIRVLADPTQVHQVVMNLCTNAAHSMEGKPGRIDLHLACLEIEAENAGSEGLKRGRYAHFSVRDTGSGMDAGTLARVFEPFFTTKAVGKGTGLGLSVVHGIMQAHDGVVRAESRPGKGSTFHLYFPVVEHEAEVVEALKPEMPAAAGHGKRVLYVDDDEALVLMVTRLLERQDYRVSGHTWAVEALDELRADPRQFDLVVTDYNMPGMSGLDVAREIRAIRPDLPVVLTSGYITDELRTKATEAGVRNLLYKPNTVQELCETVQTLTSELTEKKPSENKEKQ